MPSDLSIWLVFLSLAAWGAIHLAYRLRTIMLIPQLPAKGKPALARKG